MLKFLLVSDTHAGFENLTEIVRREIGNFDYVIHSGDFANILDSEKHLVEEQKKGEDIYRETLRVLKTGGKPVICIPGNVFFYLA